MTLPTKVVITPDGWVDGLERIPGPRDKVYAVKNELEGLACHSMEGWWTYSLQLLMEPNKKSWMFSNLVNGRLVQHYPLTSCPWASGNFKANTKLWPTESEGVAGTPLNDLQVANMLFLALVYETYTGRKATRGEAARTVWQHNEVWDWDTPNAGPTACPSGRYDGFFAALEARVDKPAPAPEPVMEDKILRDAMAAREALRHLASDPDHIRVMNAVAVLKQAGYYL